MAGQAADRLERLAPLGEVTRGRIGIALAPGLLDEVRDHRVCLDVVPRQERLRVLVRGAHVPDLGHARGTERARLLDPAVDPLLARLGDDLGEVRAHLAQVFPALDLVAAVAAVLLEEEAAGVERNRLGDLDLALMALHALGLGVALGHHRVVPEVEGMVRVGVAVVLAPVLLLRRRRGDVDGAHEAGGAAASLVARRAAHLVDRMRALEVEGEVGMGRERLLLVLEPLLVDAEVAGRAAVHLGRGREDHVVLQVRGHDLVDLERRVGQVQHGQVAHGGHEAGLDLLEAVFVPVVVPEELLALLLRVQARRLELRDLLVLGVLARVDVLELDPQLLPAVLVVLEVRELLVLVALVLVRGLFVVVALDVDLRLREAEVLVDGVPLALELVALGLGLLDLVAALRLFLLRAVHLRLQGLLLRGGDLVLGLLGLLPGDADLERVEGLLVLLPLAVVVRPDHDREGHEHGDGREREDHVELARAVRHVGIASGFRLGGRCH